jgi:hypothetical protein
MCGRDGPLGGSKRHREGRTGISACTSLRSGGAHSFIGQWHCRTIKSGRGGLAVWPSCLFEALRGKADPSQPRTADSEPLNLCQNQ